MSFSSSYAAPLAPQKKAKEKIVIDPSFTTMGGQLNFDEYTRAALDRSKRPNYLEALSETPGTIFSIEIIGAKKTETDAVVLRLRSRLSQPFDRLLVRQDIKEIEKMGPFSDVEVWDKTRPSGAVDLKYVLKEIPSIFQIKIAGNHVLSEDEIKENLAGLENYHIARPARLSEAALKIRDFYESKGYFLATVDYATKKTSADDIKKREDEGINENIGAAAFEIDTVSVFATDFVDVVFTINEGDKVRINRISFSGNFHITDDKFKEHLRSQEGHLLSAITDWGTFRKEFLDIDSLVIDKVLHDNGFLQANVLEPIVKLSPDKSEIAINFRVIENTQFRLGEVSVSGDLIERSQIIYDLKKESKPNEPLFLASNIQSLISQKEGEIFNKSMMQQNVIAMAAKYQDEGYAYANIIPIPKFDEEQKTVDINIEISSGPLISIERIDIEGNEKTKDEVIRRELPIFEGGRYSASLNKMGEINLHRLNYFETIEMTNEPGSSPDKMVISIKVKEKSTGNIQANAGYGSGGEGFILGGQISNQNLFGRGQALSASLSWSSGYRRIFDVNFVEPYLAYLFDEPLTLAFTAFNREVNMGEFSRKSSGGDITFGYPFGGPFAKYSRQWKKNASEAAMPYVFDFEALMLLLTYTVERVEISDLSVAVKRWDLHQGVPRYTTSLRPAIRLDQRDNRMFPSRGLFFEFRSEFASEHFGGKNFARLENYLRKKSNANGLRASASRNTPNADSNNFMRFVTNLRFYHNLDDWFFLKGLVFKTNFELGLLNDFGRPLLFENFALGGSSTIRGYNTRSISPTERSSPLFAFDSRRDVHVGGNKQFYGSMELEFPVLKALKISGVLFFDFGNVYSHEDNLFFIGGKSANAARVQPADPLGIYSLLGLYSSAGIGIRWNSPLGLLRFEWGFPLNARPASTPGLAEKDPSSLFEFAIGPSF